MYRRKKKVLCSPVRISLAPITFRDGGRRRRRGQPKGQSRGRTDGRFVIFFPPSPVLIFPTFSKKKSTRISLLFVREIDALSRAKQNIQLHRRRKKTPKTGLKDIAAPSANRGTTQNKEKNAQFEHFQGITQPRQNIFHRIFKGCDFCFFRTNKERRICVHELRRGERERIQKTSSNNATI